MLLLTQALLSVTLMVGVESVSLLILKWVFPKKVFLCVLLTVIVKSVYVSSNDFGSVLVVGVGLLVLSKKIARPAPNYSLLGSGWDDKKLVMLTPKSVMAMVCRLGVREDMLYTRIFII